MIYGISGVTNIEELNIIIKINDCHSGLNISVPMIFIIVGLLFKLGAAPFHN